MLYRPESMTHLMRSANRGDQDAYRKALGMLAEWLRTSVRRSLARANRGSEDTEDIVQETLLAIHLKRHTWDERQPLEPWVRSIAHHKLVDHLRRRGFRDHLNIADFANELSDPRSMQAARDVEQRDMMSCLNDRQRSIVDAIAVQGLTAREFGAQIGMTEGAVRVALHRALKVLADVGRRGES